MLRYDRRLRAFALCLAGLAGFVDAAGFLLTQGLFVSFMSGNSTRLGVGLAEGAPVALLAGGLILMFFLGVVGGSLIALWRPSVRKSLVLAVTMAILVLAAILVSAGFPLTAAFALAAAMGALNNVFLREGEVSIGVTYMTGTLVRAGQRLAQAITGKGSSDWLPYLLLWGALVLGTALGAVAAAASPALTLWISAALAGGLAAFAARFPSPTPD